MKPVRHLPGKLRRPLLGLLCSALLATAAVLWSQAGLQEARQDNATARLQVQQLTQQLNQARSDAATMDETIRRYRQLRESGMIGDARPQQWASALEKIRQDRAPRLVAYDIGERIALADAHPAVSAFAARLRLQADVRHEGELLELLALVERQSSALTAWQGCRLTRRNSPEEGLQASCEGHLITLLPAAKSK